MDLFSENTSDQFLDDVAAGRPTLYDQELARDLDALRHTVQETPLSREIVTNDEAELALLMGRVQYRPKVSPSLRRIALVSVMIGLVCIILLVAL